MAEETHFTPNTGMQTLTTGGSVSSAIVTGASNGTIIKTVTIKAQGNTTHGKVSLYIYDGTNSRLFKEIDIPAVTKSASAAAFQTILPLNLKIESGWSLKASTTKDETFNIIAEGMDWSYYATSVRPDTTKYAAYNAATTVSTANSNLDGTGTLGTALASGGTNLRSITIKAKGNTTEGMVRLFLYDGANSTKLWMEIPVTAITQSATFPTFSRKIFFDSFFAIKSGWQLKASTEKAEAFNIIPEAMDISYPA